MTDLNSIPDIKPIISTEKERYCSSDSYLQYGIPYWGDLNAVDVGEIIAMCNSFKVPHHLTLEFELLHTYPHWCFKLIEYMNYDMPLIFGNDQNHVASLYKKYLYTNHLDEHTELPTEFKDFQKVYNMIYHMAVTSTCKLKNFLDSKKDVKDEEIDMILQQKNLDTTTTESKPQLENDVDSARQLYFDTFEFTSNNFILNLMKTYINRTVMRIDTHINKTKLDECAEKLVNECIQYLNQEEKETWTLANVRKATCLNFQVYDSLMKRLYTCFSTYFPEMISSILKFEELPSDECLDKLMTDKINIKTPFIKNSSIEDFFQALVMTFSELVLSPECISLFNQIKAEHYKKFKTAEAQSETMRRNDELIIEFSKIQKQAQKEQIPLKQILKDKLPELEAKYDKFPDQPLKWFVNKQAEKDKRENKTLNMEHFKQRINTYNMFNNIIELIIKKYTLYETE